MVSYEREQRNVYFGLFFYGSHFCVISIFHQDICQATDSLFTGKVK